MSTQPPSTGSARARLTGFGVIRARGEDAARFLHGQLTQDVLQLPSDAARLAAFCSAKGRMLASFVMWKPALDEVLLVCSADVLPATLKRLSMFVMRAKCRLDDASSEYELHGVWAPAEGPLLAAPSHLPAVVWTRAVTPDGGTALRLPSPATGALWLLALPRGDAAAPAFRWPAEWTSVQALPEAPPEAFTAACVAAGLAWVVAATTEQFVPQMVNFELIGGVNFQKGCYPGQEVVARSQYRGTVKRRLQRFTVGAAAQPGQELFNSLDPGQPAGLVALAAPVGSGGANELLAEVKLAALNEGSLHLGGPDGPVLQVLPLPYALPAAEATPSDGAAA